MTRSTASEAHTQQKVRRSICSSADYYPYYGFPVATESIMQDEAERCRESAVRCLIAESIRRQSTSG